MDPKLLEALDAVTQALSEDSEHRTAVEKELKTRFGEKLKEPLTLDSVETFLSSDEKGKAYLTSQVSTKKKELIKEYLKSDEYKNDVSAKIAAAKAEAEEAVRKELNKELTPEQKKIKDLETKQAKLENEALVKDIKAEAVIALNENKLPKEFIKLVVDNSSVEQTKENITNLASYIEKEIESGVKAKFKEIGRQPIKGDDSTPIKISQQIVDDLYKKAQKSGKLEDRAAYASAKAALRQQEAGSKK